MKLIFKYFFISLLFLNGQLVHAQSFKIDSLKGKKWELQLPKGKSYTSNLIFKDTTYTTSFSFNGQTHTIEKPYLIQQEIQIVSIMPIKCPKYKTTAGII